jgi:hypothetical protein
MAVIAIEVGRLGVGGGIHTIDTRTLLKMGRYRIEAMDRLMTALTGDIPVTAGVAHQPRLAWIVEGWMVIARLVSARLNIGSGVAIGAMGLTGGKPVITPISGC